MAALQCEICGGKLMGRPGGIFECDSCGMEYDTAWAKAKIQEIKGTVKVEGTVEVTGKVQIDGGIVKVEGGINIESLLKRGQLALEDEQWNDATKFFDEALNLNAESAEAYLGKLCAQYEQSSIEQLFGELKTLIQMEQLGKNQDFQKALRFADPKASEILRQKFDEQFAQIQQALQQFRSASVALREKFAPARGHVAAGKKCTVGLKADGTVVAVGDDMYWRCSDVSHWRDIVAVAAGDYHTVGLRADGTVVAVGNDEKGQRNVADWRDIVAIAAGSYHTVGLKADGTVVAVGSYEGGQCNVSDWHDIVAIAADGEYTVGLKADGTVVAVGVYGFYGYRKDIAPDWTGIIAIAARASIASLHLVGLKADGTVVAVGDRRNVSDWRDIVSIAAGGGHTVGLKADGTVIANGISLYGECDVSGWSNIVAIAAGGFHTVGLKADGTVIAVGDNEKGECDVSGWKLFNSIETLAQEQEETRLCAERKAKRKAELNAEKARLENELSNLRGLFTGKRRQELEGRIAEINNELKGM